MAQAGFKTTPVDCHHNKHVPRTQVLILDLTNRTDQITLINLIKSSPTFAIHVALPCGTGSRARERPIARHLLKQGAPQPVPLRSAEYLLGIPGLTASDASRVELSNQLAKFTVDLIELAMTLGFFISIENPENSWMWGVLCHYVLAKKSVKLSKFWNDLVAVNFANCAHGGERDKKTKFLCNRDWLASMALPCPKNHVHKPFTLKKTAAGWRFDTAQEGEYPVLLCERYAKCLQRHSNISTHPSAVPNRIPSNIQQTKRHPQLIPEYHRVVFSDSPPKADHKLLLPANGGENGAKAKYGIYHTPEQFVKFAKTLVHPFDIEHRVPDVLRRNIHDVLSGGVQKLVDFRVKESKRLAQLKHELRYEEARLHAVLPAHAKIVLKGKSLVLLQHLLKEQQFPDLNICDLMKGVDLVGEATKSPLFADKVAQATTSPEMLLQSSQGSNEKILGRDVHQSEPDLAQVLWETTLKECDQGFLEGPFDSMDEVRSVLGSDDFVCSRRFVVLQNGKPRVIDDLKESNINAAYTAVDRLALQDIDFVSSLAFTISRACRSESPRFELPLEDGTVLGGSIHADFRKHPQWAVRCLDLAKAYKQVPISEESRPFGVLVLHQHGTGIPKFFITRSLPFGACASVFAFNRISRSLWFLAVKLMKIIGGCFYDDFPLIEPEITAQVASSAIEHLLSCLGWVYSSDPAKSRPFEPECDVLGVRIDVCHLSQGRLKLKNKPSRVEKLKSLFNSLREARKFTKRDAQVIHGTLNFMTSFVMGHSLKLACRVFANLSKHHASVDFNRVDLLLRWTESLLDNIEPRILDCRGETTPLLIFTDAAFEDGVATWGCVVIDPSTGAAEVSGGSVPDFLVKCWQNLAGEQIITQAEAFAVLLARRAYEALVKQRRVIFFVDNEAARYALIHASSPSVSLLKIVQSFHSCSESDSSISWLERVPSPSNIADLPSRGRLNDAAHLINGKVVDLASVAQVISLELSVFDDPSFDFLVTFSKVASEHHPFL